MYPGRTFLPFIMAFLSLFFLIEGRGVPQEGEKPLIQLIIKERKIRVEVAQSEDEKARGLMFRESLAKNEGMLFVYDREEILTFWMKNTPIPLSIAFIDRKGTIVDIQDMEPFNLRIHASAWPARYALEMNKGWFRRNGIGVGDRLKIPPLEK